jgi:hypothetical protein
VSGVFRIRTLLKIAHSALIPGTVTPSARRVELWWAERLYVTNLRNAVEVGMLIEKNRMCTITDHTHHNDLNIPTL